MGKRARIGDIVQIPTERGFGYARYTHRNSLMGQLLRVLPGVHEDVPSLEWLATSPPVFTVFFPLQAVLNRGGGSIVANESVPESERAFPLFRAPVYDLATGIPRSWWLWDGEREWPIGELSAEQRLLPLRQIVTEDQLKHWIATGYRPEDDD